MRLSWLFIAGCSRLLGQNVIADTTDGALAASVVYGSLAPGRSSALPGGQVQFRLYGKSNSGYRLDASASFSVTTTGQTSGGSTITASDIGVGIISIVPGPNAGTPRTDTISTGFGYDPTTAAVTNGLTPYKGAGNGQATLADLATAKQILRGPKIANNTNLGQGNYLTVTLRTGLLPQYFTPGSFTATITLTISNGP